MWRRPLRRLSLVPQLVGSSVSHGGQDEFSKTAAGTLFPEGDIHVKGSCRENGEAISPRQPTPLH